MPVLGIENAADVSGTFQRRQVRISEISLGKQAIGLQAAFVVDDQKYEGDNFDGVLGIRGLRFSKIAFDFEHRMSSWQPQNHRLTEKTIASRSKIIHMPVDATQYKRAPLVVE